MNSIVKSYKIILKKMINLTKLKNIINLPNLDFIQEHFKAYISCKKRV
jgi:hypothetical protein